MMLFSAFISVNQRQNGYFADFFAFVKPMSALLLKIYDDF